MKSILLLPLMMPLVLHAQAPRIRDATTHDQLAKTHREAQQNGPMKGLAKATPPAPGAVEPIPDIISTSDILSFNDSATLVPKRAILNQPKGLATRINNFQKGTKFVGWIEFLQSNRGWITAIEVTRAQAEGKEPIDEKIVENYRKSTNLVVATFKGGPISVLPLREPEKKEPIPTDNTQKKTQP